MSHIIHQFLVLQDIIWSVSQFFCICGLLRFPSCHSVSHAYVWMSVCDSFIQWPKQPIILIFIWALIRTVTFLTGFCYSCYQPLVIVFLFFSPMCFPLFSCTFSYFFFFFSFSRRKKEALLLLRPPARLHLLLRVVNRSSLAPVQQQPLSPGFLRCLLSQPFLNPSVDLKEPH